MWMSDKPLVQEQLADSIGKLILCFGHLDASYLFIDCAFSTLTREWNGLDRLRIDKFMVLVRRLLRYSFALMKKNNWDPKVVSDVTEVFNKSVTSVDSKSKSYVSVSIRFHIADLYCEELAKVAGGSIDHAVIQLCLEPFIQIITMSTNDAYCHHVEHAIFEHLIDQSDVKELEKVNLDMEQEDFEDLEDEGVDMDEDMDEEEEEEFVDNSTLDKGVPLDPRAGNVGVFVPQLEVDFTTLADHIFSAASKPDVRSVNRKLAYAIVKKLKETVDILEGNVPVDLAPQEETQPKRKRNKPWNVRASAHKLNKFKEEMMLSGMDSEDDEDGDEVDQEDPEEDLGDIQPMETKAKNKKKKKDKKIKYIVLKKICLQNQEQEKKKDKK